LAFSGFGHPALITICALMIMGRGLVVTGALEPMVRVLERVWQLNRWLGLLVTLLFAFLMSMVINDTPVLVLLLPILVQLAARGGMASSKTLIPVNAAVLIGGMGTTIGTSTNLLVVSIAVDLGLPAMPVFHFTPVVLMAAAVALPYLWLVMPRLLPDNSVAATHEPRRFRSTLRIGGTSEFVGKRIDEFEHKLPEGFTFHNPPIDALAADARLTVSGTHEALEEATRRLGARLAPEWLLNRIGQGAKEQGVDLVVAELALTADSRLSGLAIPASGIADAHGVAILGVDFAPRPHGTGAHDPASAPLGEGDVLLVIGTLDRLREFAQADALLILDGMTEVPRRAKALLALGIMGGAVGLASVGLLPIAISALAGAIAMFVTGCVRFDRVGRALVGPGHRAGRGLHRDRPVDYGKRRGGLAGAGSGGFLSVPAACGYPGGDHALRDLLTNFASNATAATVGTPIAINVARALRLPPEPLVLAVLFGCNLCYATPIAYQTNMLIMAEGGYQFRDYVRAGVPLAALMIVRCRSCWSCATGFDRLCDLFAIEIDRFHRLQSRKFRMASRRHRAISGHPEFTLKEQ
jgi:hypothetical protein